MFSLNIFTFISGIIELLLLKHVCFLLFKFLNCGCFCVSFLSHNLRIYTYKLLLFYLIDPLCVDLIDDINIFAVQKHPQEGKSHFIFSVVRIRGRK